MNILTILLTLWGGAVALIAISLTSSTPAAVVLVAIPNPGRRLLRMFMQLFGPLA